MLVAKVPCIFRHAFRDVDILIFFAGIALPIIFSVYLHIFQTLYLFTHPAFLLAFSELCYTEFISWDSSITARTCSVSGPKIQSSLPWDDVKRKVCICFVVVERPFCFASIQISILFGCNSKTGLSSSIHLLQLLIQSEHRFCIHNAVLYKLIRKGSVFPHFRILFQQLFSLVLYFDQLLVLEVQLKAATETIYFLHFICSLAFKPFDEENRPTTHLPGMIFANLFFFL